jgi:hypothetical protein
MNYNEFYNQVQGKPLNYNNIPAGSPCQCVSLSKAYSDWVWGLKTHSIGYSGGAKDILKPNAIWDDSDVQRIPNTPTGIPPQGAIASFDGASNNQYGHTGVVVSANMFELTIIEQNGGMGKGQGLGSDAPRLKTYKYTANSSGVGKVLGWVIPKNGKLV